MSCREPRDPRICPREPFGTTNRGPISPAASGCPTPDMANLRPAWPAISPGGWRKRRTAITPELLSYIVRRIAGCRGTQPSAPSPSAIRMSHGIPKGPMAGAPPAFPWKMPRQSSVQTNSRSSRLTNRSLFRRRIGVQDVLDRTSQIKQPLLDENRHIADVLGRFSPILENARLPRKAIGEFIALRLVGIRPVLQFPHLLGFVAYLLGHRLLLA